MLELLPTDFDRGVIAESKFTPVVLKFFSRTCGPCKVLDVPLTKLAGQFAGRIHFYRVDIELNAEVCQAYDVHAVPTLIMFRDGHEVARLVGAKWRYAALEEWLNHNKGKSSSNRS